MIALIVDIGSNSIRAMKVESAGSGLDFFPKRVFTTRLAEGLLSSGRLNEARMAQSLSVLRQLKAEAAASDMPVYAYATSAVRDAGNRNDFLNAVRRDIAVDVDVLDGRQEARMAFLGAAGGQGGLMDIGGGSTQLVTADCAHSFPLGCVRARDVCGETDDFDALRAALRPALRAAISLPRFPALAWTGVGGSITTIAAVSLGLDRYDAARISGRLLSLDAIQNALYHIAALGDTRSSHPLLKERHDVILQGGAILLYIMEALTIQELLVSDADGMEGYAMQLASKSQVHC